MLDTPDPLTSSFSLGLLCASCYPLVPDCVQEGGLPSDVEVELRARSRIYAGRRPRH
jgi:hypothetical protein